MMQWHLVPLFFALGAYPNKKGQLSLTLRWGIVLLDPIPTTRGAGG
jgi:hypothetical protein